MLPTVSLGLSVVLLQLANVCPGHNLHQKRDASTEKDYVYGHNAFNWGHIKPEYEACQIGTQQTPINLYNNGGYSTRHVPEFNYPSSVEGTLENSGTSLSFTITSPDDITTLPSIRFQETEGSAPEEVYLIGWHLHTPSEHIIDDAPARAEMHFVHVDVDENYRSVVAILINPRNGSESRFFEQMTQPFPALGSDTTKTVTINHNLAFNDIGGFDEFWTYKGSLTTPPCTQGLRWFVAKEPLYVDNDMMTEILKISKFSARPVQQMWMQALNE